MPVDPTPSRPVIRVAPPVSYAAIQDPPPAGKVRFPVGIAPGPPPPARSGPEPTAPDRVAVVVCHGMGQQVPFEHIDAVAQAVLRGSPRGGAAAQVRVGYATLGEQRLPRAEIELEVEGLRREVHVYEAYWAPLTEGRVSALAVTRFLLDAGFRGMRYALRGRFTRWLMGGWKSFSLGARTLLALVAAFAVVASALALYGALGVTVALRAGELLFGDALRPEARQLSAQLFRDLVRSPLLLSLALLPGGALLWLLRLRPGRQPLEPRGSRVATAASVVAAALLGAWTVVAGGLVVTDAARALVGASVWRGWLGQGAAPWLSARLVPDDVVQPLVSGAAFQLFFLLSAVLLCLRVRGLYVQYLGDVAVYLASHKLNEFFELRGRIRQIGEDVGCAVYSALRSPQGQPEYDGVVVTGHSLGSVVAYDTLNAVLNRDHALGGALHAEQRTLRFLTFGSPLDKSAFIFRTQVENSEIREALAAAVQPLIEPPSAARTIPWVNLHSAMDPVSGAVQFYDPPAGEDTPAGHLRVRNLPDSAASVFGHAHTVYWRSALFARELYAAVTSPLPVRR